MHSYTYCQDFYNPLYLELGLIDAIFSIVTLYGLACSLDSVDTHDKAHLVQGSETSLSLED